MRLFVEVKVPGTLSRGLNFNSCFVCIVYLVSIGNISAYLNVVTTVISTCIDYSLLKKCDLSYIQITLCLGY